jgi:hypothetical protein
MTDTFDELKDFIQNPNDSVGKFQIMKEYRRCPYTNGMNVMEDIYQASRHAEINYIRQKEALERTIEKRQKVLNRMVKEHDSRSWIDKVLKPLVDIVSSQMAAIHNEDQPWPYKIYGPFGLRCQTTVYIFPAGGEDILDDETYSLTVFPVGEIGKTFRLEYDTGKLSQDYEPGSLGDINGFNRITDDLPDRLGEIIAKFRHHPARKKPVENMEVIENE